MRGGATLYYSRGVSQIHASSKGKETDLFDYCQGVGCSVESQIIGRLLWIGVSIEEVSRRELDSWAGVL